MLRLLIALSVVFGLACLGGCATSSTVTSAPVEAGTSRDFAAPYDAVKTAALTTLGRLALAVDGQSETPARYQISFSKSLNAFSWGEVGVVNIVRMEPQRTRVYVNTAKRSMVQVTGTTEAEFAADIFAGIAQDLGHP